MTELSERLEALTDGAHLQVVAYDLERDGATPVIAYLFGDAVLLAWPSPPGAEEASVSLQAFTAGEPASDVHEHTVRR